MVIWSLVKCSSLGLLLHLWLLPAEDVAGVGASWHWEERGSTVSVWVRQAQGTLGIGCVALWWRGSSGRASTWERRQRGRRGAGEHQRPTGTAAETAQGRDGYTRWHRGDPRGGGRTTSGDQHHAVGDIFIRAGVIWGWRGMCQPKRKDCDKRLGKRYETCEALCGKNPPRSMFYLASCFGLGLASICKHSCRDSSDRDTHISHACTSLNSQVYPSAWMWIVHLSSCNDI